MHLELDDALVAQIDQRSGAPDADRVGWTIARSPCHGIHSGGGSHAFA